MRHKRLPIIGLLLLSVTGVMLACGETSTTTSQPTSPATSAPAPTATTQPQEAKEILNISGAENTQTETIHIPEGSTAKWTMTPSSLGEQSGAVLSIYGQGGEGSNAYDLVANIYDTKAHSGTYTFHGGNDEYFTVTVANGSFTLIITTP